MRYRATSAIWTLIVACFIIGAWIHYLGWITH